MKPDDREPQHFLGVPFQPGGKGIPADNTEQRVLGMPRSWVAPKPIDVRWVRHPIRWTRWRLQVHRLGAYAPSYEELNTARGR